MSTNLKLSSLLCLVSAAPIESQCVHQVPEPTVLGLILKASLHQFQFLVPAARVTRINSFFNWFVLNFQRENRNL